MILRNVAIIMQFIYFHLLWKVYMRVCSTEQVVNFVDKYQHYAVKNLSMYTAFNKKKMQFCFIKIFCTIFYYKDTIKAQTFITVHHVYCYMELYHSNT